MQLLNDERLFKANIVQMILMKKTDEAIRSLSDFYTVDIPHVKIGLPKKHSKSTGCYVAKTKTIHVSNGEKLEDPFVILHEFYHHLRTQDGKHRGTEKYANKFAVDFVEAFQTCRKCSFHVSYK
jgi:hypothetical protein